MSKNGDATKKRRRTNSKKFRHLNSQEMRFFFLVLLSSRTAYVWFTQISHEVTKEKGGGDIFFPPFLAFLTVFGLLIDLMTCKDFDLAVAENDEEGLEGDSHASLFSGLRALHARTYMQTAR